MKTETNVEEELLSTVPVSRKQNLDMAEITGGDGFWQHRIFFIVFLLQVPCSLNMFSVSFLAPNLDHWCARSPEATNLSVEQWRTLAMPLDDQYCSRYEYIDLADSLQNRTNVSGQAVIPCETWEYDTSFYHSTILKQFDLVCDRKWLVSFLKSVFVAGMSISLIVFGHLSDRIGRKPVIIISGFITFFSGITSAFSVTFAMFIVAHFFVALGVTVFFSTPFVLLMEIVSPKYRSIYGIGIHLGWSSGMVLLPLVAWLIRDSVWIQLAVTSPCLILLAIPWIPESPRWLLNHGKEKEAQEILLTAAKTNGVKHSEDGKQALKTIMTKGVEAYKAGGTKGNVLDLLKTPGLRKITLNVYFNWFVISFVFYGFSMNTNELAGDPFVNFALIGFVEIPAYLLTILAVRSLGQKRLLIASMTASGFACFTLCLIPQNLWWLTVAISMMGKFSITIAFGIIYIFSSELFPTVVRNSGLGSASLCARIGSMFAPFMRELGDATHPIFPRFIFGALAIASGLLVIILPETKNCSVPDTMEEAAQFSRKKNSVLLKETKRNCVTVKLTEINNGQDATNLLVK